MCKNFIALILLVSGIANVSLAQQDMMLTHFMYNKMGLNPGSTGMDEGFCATSIYRNQWDKVSGAPNTGLLNAEGNLNRWYGLGGVGINFYHDAIGFSRQNNIMFNYSQPIPIPNGDRLGIGLGLGLQSLGIGNEWITPDGTPSINDNSIPQGFASKGLDINFGLYYQSARNFYIGLSSTHLNSASLINRNDKTQTYELQQHLYLMAGYKYKLGTSSNYLDFQTLIKNDTKLTQFELNTRFIYGSMGYAGLTYRTSDAVSLMLGFNPLKNFTVGYSYDFTLNKLSSISKGSHELLIKYCYYLPIPPVAVTRHPRWL
jgi:type IX secretion system PorP/SprF family membrane protein